MLPPKAQDDLRRWFTQPELDAFRYTSRGLIAWLLRHSFKQGAVTWNGVVNFALSPYDPDTPGGLAMIAHEMMHVRQQRQQGWWCYLARYAWPLRHAQYRGHNNPTIRSKPLRTRLCAR